MAVVTHQVRLPDGSAPDFFVAIRLIAGTGDAEGHVPSLHYSVGGVSRPVVAAGAWQADLTPNGAVIPGGTVYEVVESLPGGTVVSYITVPSAGGRLEDLLTVSPATLPARPLTALPPRVVTGGNLGATPALDVRSEPQVWLTGTLTANATLTLSNLAAGSTVRLLLVQDATGGRTLTVALGAASAAVPVPLAAGASCVVDLFSADGADLYVRSSS